MNENAGTARLLYTLHISYPNQPSAMPQGSPVDLEDKANMNGPSAGFFLCATTSKPIMFLNLIIQILVI